MQKIAEKIVNVFRAHGSYNYHKGFVVLFCSLYVMNKVAYRSLKSRDVFPEKVMEFFHGINIYEPTIHIINIYAALRLALISKSGNVTNTNFSQVTSYGWDSFYLPRQQHKINHLDQMKRNCPNFVEHLEDRNIIQEVCSHIESSL